MGKVSFCDLKDKSGRIQIYARKDEMDEEAYDRFRKYDIGDIVGVKGDVFRTQKGEMSIRAHEITLLSKSLQPLPEKFHGLTDKELRYRQRYVDPVSYTHLDVYKRQVWTCGISGAATCGGTSVLFCRSPSCSPRPLERTSGQCGPMRRRMPCAVRRPSPAWTRR